MSSAKPAKKITMMISKAALTGRSVPSLKNHTASISASEAEAQRKPFVKVNIHSESRLAAACPALYSEFCAPHRARGAACVNLRLPGALMTIVFESILPVFLLVILGVALRRSTLVDQGLWIGLEQFGYYFLFPALLFSTLAKADLAGLEADATAVATVGSVTLMSAALLSAWPLLRRSGISGPTFTSVFQTATRWNAFIALAVAEKLFGTAGLSLTALVMALLIIPINFYNIAVLTWFGGGSRGIGFFFLKIVTNPLIISSALGILFNLTGIELYEPVMTAVDMLASASLGLGLILVGAGLKIADALNPSIPVLFAVVLKLIVMPVFMVGSSALLGIRGDALLVIAVGAAVPTAMNGYLLAKQMGGDAELYASVATIQTAASFLTIPLVLFVTGYVAAG